MRLLLIRHGDPDYEHDSLTDVGRIEADLLAERMKCEEVTHFYVSPLGRAQATAAPTLRLLGREAETKDWLREFPASVEVNGSLEMQRIYPNTRHKEDGSFVTRSVCWDMAPSGWAEDERYYDVHRWMETPSARAGNMEETYRYVCESFDALLAEHGYHRVGNHYETEQGSHETLAFFCHFGLTTMLLSHLWHMSPYVLAQDLALAPTSVTEVYTEEREKGIVSFRAAKLGDISHLYAARREPSFSARFCEVYEDDTRH